MREKNLVTAKGQEPTVPLTRARAAAFLASGKLPYLKAPLQLNQKRAPIQQNQKRTLRGNPKGADLDENSNHAPTDACLQRKRRVVLQDVSNICHKGSFGSCLNATKIQVNIPCNFVHDLCSYKEITTNLCYPISLLSLAA